VNFGLGVGLIVAGGLLGLLIVFGAWRRLPRALAYGSLAGCGVLVGAGGLLVQEQVSGIEWAITLLVLGALTPVHARLVFGHPGPSA
jgi:hypothetical protein